MDMLSLSMDYDDIKSYYELITENEQLESMIHIYQEEIEIRVKEIDGLKEEIKFLREQLEYKTLGLPIYSQEETIEED
tara:strand:+ start:1239 stop:1472 length:234 start_codon:yes stop_codon:yes gene_type:complete